MNPHQQHRLLSPESAELGERIGELRPSLLMYVLSLLPDRDACNDVVQETCLFLWNNRDDFQPGTNFKAWAYKTAWFKVQTHRREMQRRKVVTFSQPMLDRISKGSAQIDDDPDPRLSALRACVNDLPETGRQLLKLKYLDQLSLTDHAKSLGVKPNQIQKSLSRIRIALRRCVENRLASSHE